MHQKLNVFFLIGILSLLSCDTRVVFQEFVALKDKWPVAPSVTFYYKPSSASVASDIYLRLRVDRSYPYHNLYVSYAIHTDTDTLLSEKLKEFPLFDIKTGKPLGSGLGDVFDYEFLLESQLNFLEDKLHTVSLTQFMRADTLRGINRVGLMIRTSSP